MAFMVVEWFAEGRRLPLGGMGDGLCRVKPGGPVRQHWEQDEVGGMMYTVVLMERAKHEG